MDLNCRKKINITFILDLAFQWHEFSNLSHSQTPLNLRVLITLWQYCFFFKVI